MNCEVIELGAAPLEVEVYQIREALRVLLHSVLFHRTLGAVRPREVDSELVDLTYVRARRPPPRRRAAQLLQRLALRQLDAHTV